MPEALNSTAPVTVARDGDVVVLTLSRPERRNPLSVEAMTALRDGLREAGADPAVRAVIIGSEGPVFSAGHDLRELAAGDAATHERIFALCADLMLTVHRLEVPVIARVQGLATAAGCQLVAACDLAIASRTAAFATPGVRIGLFCTTPMVEVLRAVGRGRAMEMLLTGDPVDATTAAQWGLVNRVVEPERLDDEVRALVARIVAAGRTVVAGGKRAVDESLGLPLDEAYRRASAIMCRDAQSADAEEGIAAFLEKRAPVWSDPA
jgi:enoyl-CoA hydratase/carnithine racemase